VGATDLTVKDADGDIVGNENDATSTGVYEIAALSGASIVSKLLDAGNYSVTGKVGDKVIVPAYFTVTDSQKAPSVKQLESQMTISNNDNLYTKLVDCFEESSNSEATSTSLVVSAIKTTAVVSDAVSGSAIAVDGVYNVLVEKVTVTENFSNGLSVETDVTVNKVISVKVD